VSFFDHDHPVDNAVAQDVFQGSGHGSTGFSGTHHQNPVETLQFKFALADNQGFSLQPDTAQYRFDRIHRF